MRKFWNTQRLSDGRGYANNGRMVIYASSIPSLYRLIRKYRHSTGVVSQRKDGTVIAQLYKA